MNKVMMLAKEIACAVDDFDPYSGLTLDELEDATRDALLLFPEDVADQLFEMFDECEDDDALANRLYVLAREVENGGF